MKNSADLGGCYPPRPSASVDNTLLDLQNSSYPTQPHSIIAKYSPRLRLGEYSTLLKTGSLYNAIQGIWLAWWPYTMPNKYGTCKCTRDFGAFLFLLVSIFLYFGGVFNKTIILLALVGYDMIIANSALGASLAIYHLLLFNKLQH